MSEAATIATDDPSLVWSSELASVWRANCLDVDHVARVMGKQKADALIFDGPFSPRTHNGHREGKMTADRAAAFAARGTAGRTRERAYSARKAAKGESGRRDIDYASWSAGDVRRFCDIWCPITTGWIVSITDDVLAPAWRTSFVRHGLYPFAPLPLVETGSRVRMTGDGPSGWTCWVVVARPRGEPWSSWGTLRGGYVVPGERDINSIGGTDRIVGGKSLLAMQCIVADYSRRNDLVVDPTSGGGTTLRAALAQGRRAIGLEQDPGRAELTAKACRAVNIGQGELSLGGDR
jgi:hypothetical protein